MHFFLMNEAHIYELHCGVCGTRLGWISDTKRTALTRETARFGSRVPSVLVWSEFPIAALVR